MYFYIFFHSHVFPKNTNNVIRITLPNGTIVFLSLSMYIYIYIYVCVYSFLAVIFVFCAVMFPFIHIYKPEILETVCLIIYILGPRHRIDPNFRVREWFCTVDQPG